MVELAHDLNKEEQRAVEEDLSENELAIFDLLIKDNLNPDEIAKVKLTAKEILLKLKDKLVSDWREFEPTRAGVKTTIADVLYADLPDPKYKEADCDLKGHEVYNFVYENYRDASVLAG